MRPCAEVADRATGATARENRPALNLSAAESRVHGVIGYEPMLRDVILRAAELPPGDVMAALTSLELKGLIKQLPGQLVVRHGVA